MPTRVEFRALSGDSRFAYLQIGQVDLLARNGPWTMRRDTGYGANYVASAFYDGQAFMVPLTLGVVSAYELDNISVCVLDDERELSNLREFFFLNQVSYDEVLYEDREDLSVAYSSGLCNAVSAPASWLHAIRRGLPDPAAHRILPERISKESFGPVVRNGDDQWFKIVEWTLFALINAEELGVSSANIGSLAAAKTIAIRQLPRPRRRLRSRRSASPPASSPTSSRRSATTARSSSAISAPRPASRWPAARTPSGATAACSSPRRSTDLESG